MGIGVPKIVKKFNQGDLFMKKLIVASILAAIPATSFARTASTVYCVSAENEGKAVEQLGESLASKSLTFYTDKQDGDNKRLAMRGIDITSVSAITLIKPNSQYPVAACVTVVGNGSDQ